MLGLLTDVETSLEREPDFFRALVESSEDLILVLDRAALLVYVSPSVTRLLGYEIPATLGQSLWDFIHPEDLPGALAAFRRVLQENRTRQPVELRVRHQDGSWRHFAARASVMADAGHGGRLVVNGHDITERKDFEARQRRLQEALVRAQKLESLGVLAGGIAHDFNNILGAIMGHASLAVSKLPPDAPAQRNVTAVLDAAERAAALSRRMLAFSGRGAFHLRRLELRGFLAESRKPLEAAVPKDVRLQLHVCGDAMLLDADPGQLGQALLNLVQNAVDAIGPRPGTIRVAAWPRDVTTADSERFGASGMPLEAGRYVAITVEDDGCGIEPEVLGRIFEPFFSTRLKGRGLGLSAVLGIVRGHRGEIAVASAPGVGSRFEMLLPVAAQAERAAAASVQRPAASARGVLVVDDEPALREVVLETLKAEGVPAWGAADGAQALQLLEELEGAVAVVVLDLSMPGMSAAETLRALRSRAAAVKVLLTSGHAEDALLNELEDARPAAFLQKPYRPKALLEATRILLGGTD